MTDLEDPPGEIVVLQQPAEAQQGGGVRHRLPTQVDPKKGPKRLTVVDGILKRLVGERELLLQEVHPQHPLQPDRGTPRARARLGVVVRGQRVQQHGPGHHPLHLAQEAVAARGLALGVVLGLGEGHLLGHGSGTPRRGRCVPRYCIILTPSISAEFFSVSLTVKSLLDELAVDVDVAHQGLAQLLARAEARGVEYFCDASSARRRG